MKNAMLRIRGSGSFADNGGEGGKKCADSGCHVAERRGESGFFWRKSGSENRFQRVCIQDLAKVRIDKEAVAAKMNVQRKVLMPKFSVFWTEPHDGIDLPSAPESGGPEEGSVEV